LTIAGAAAATAIARAWIAPHAASPPAFTESVANDAPADRSATSARRHVAVDQTIVVYVAGAVRRRGLYHLAPTARADDAVRAAGGATNDADLEAVNLAQRLDDGDEIAVPSSAGDGQPMHAHRTHRHPGARSGKRHRHARKHHHLQGDASPSSVVDINSASADELAMLPGIGDRLAERIVTYRTITGPFASPDDLLEVGGMTQSKLDALSGSVTARGP
jgi:competence protein ComEA